MEAADVLPAFEGLFPDCNVMLAHGRAKFRRVGQLLVVRLVLGKFVNAARAALFTLTFTLPRMSGGHRARTQNRTPRGAGNTP